MKTIEEMTEQELTEYGMRLSYLVNAVQQLKPRDALHELDIAKSVAKGYLALIKMRELYRKKFQIKKIS